MDQLKQIKTELQPLMQKIAQHPLFNTLKTLDKSTIIGALRVMSQYHVYAVYDFMCLLKALQRSVSCVSVPWFPPVDALGAHLVNQILVEEEGDISYDNRYLCHFELYLEAMEECQANTQGIRAFLEQLQSGIVIHEALAADYVPESARQFVKTTFQLIDMKIHQIAAGFVLGREDITAKMFYPILMKLEQLHVANKFAYYFRRHIELDEGSHAPKGYQLLMNLCGSDPIKWQEAKHASVIALTARIFLLNDIHTVIAVYLHGRSTAYPAKQTALI